MCLCISEKDNDDQDSIIAGQFADQLIIAGWKIPMDCTGNRSRCTANTRYLLQGKASANAASAREGGFDIDTYHCGRVSLNFKVFDKSTNSIVLSFSDQIPINGSGLTKQQAAINCYLEVAKKINIVSLLNKKNIICGR